MDAGHEPVLEVTGLSHPTEFENISFSVRKGEILGFYGLVGAGRSEVMQAVEKSGLAITDIEILRLHYAETLRHWRERFMARREEAKALYDEKFCRIWEFYLAASESAFRWQNLVVFQIQLVHDQRSVPLTRDYIGRGEDCLRAHEGDAKGAQRGARQFPKEASL